MTVLYVATSKNRLKAIEVENNTGKHVRLVQDINPIVPPAATIDDKQASNMQPIGDNGDSSRDNRTNANDAQDKINDSGSLGWYAGPKNATTEWIERHPTFDSLLYVFTSFWDTRSAVVTTYRILGVDKQGTDRGNDEKATSRTRDRGRLKKLGCVQTKGLHVSHVTFSPDHGSIYNSNGTVKYRQPPSTLCVGHYMDGSLSFFDCSQDAALGEPIRLVSLPEVRPDTKNTTFPNPLPSIHHVTYNPCPKDINLNNEDNISNYGDLDEDSDAERSLCKYLLVSDTSKQGRVWTFAVDSIGLPLSNQPVSFRKITYLTPPSGWLTRILTGSWVAGLADYRIRRCVVHPHGMYVYMLLEFNAVIQVYEINPSTGRISGDCLQEIPAIDPEYFGWKKTTGVAVQASAEMYATDTEVFVSNRGFNTWGGSAESSVRVFSVEDNGAKLVPKQKLECEGPVRHFLTNRCRNLCPEINRTLNVDCISTSPSILYVGSDKGKRRGTTNGQSGLGVDVICSASVEMFMRRDPEAIGGTFERIGLANVGLDDITCIAVLD